ncbi:hypothetical protein BUALT_Bualt17G0009600 [Buddleja alternifolia]|uniref:CCHC-type domain-containing protein n=1 Tax=Buddleja alternifolia TaxID=168488 RepID=A0AAV6W3J0_9LAMI|nr:hypothetical protein BUALT_Bualt17G0009600 [Buddleja alternifolia]
MYVQQEEERCGGRRSEYFLGFDVIKFAGGEDERAVSLHSHVTSVTVFNGLNFSEWREQVNFHLGVLDLDLTLLEEKPADITDESNDTEKLKRKAWDRSNKLCMSFMRMTIANNIKTTLPESVTAKEHLKLVEERFRSAARLKSLGMTVDDSFLVQFILNSLPPEYGPFQINYNTIKDKWDVNELSSKLTKEETRLKAQGGHTVNLVGQGASKGFKPKSKKFKKKGPAKVPQVTNGKKEDKADNCHFCKREGHYQKDCPKPKAWFEKKGTFNVYVCSESNLSEVPSNTWWLDSGATTHVSNMMQGFLTIQSIDPSKNFLFMGNRRKAPIEGIGTYRVVLDSGCNLDLFQTLYVPSLSRNLVSLSKLDAKGFMFKVGNGCFNLYNKDDCFIGSAIIVDGLYKLKFDVDFSASLMCIHQNIEIKRSLANENSAYLWHKRLGHVSKERLERLVKNEILPNLNFTDLGNAKFIENGEVSRSANKQLVDINEIRVDVPSPINIPTSTIVPNIVPEILMHLTLDLSHRTTSQMQKFWKQLLPGWKSGEITTLGSDLAATTIGKALSLREIQLGSNSYTSPVIPVYIQVLIKPVPYLTFKEATELAYSGPQVLHPQSMGAAMDGNIPARVKNSYNPKAPATLISMVQSRGILKLLVLSSVISGLEIER